LFAVLVIPLGVLTVQIATRLAVRRTGDDPAGPGVIPALVLSIAVVTMLLSVPGNWLSRQVEANADAEAIAMTGPQGLIDLQLRLAGGNLSDPDPPAAWHFIYGTHPTPVQRIGMAEAWGGSE
ncbi:MAG: M48 family metalloprotease, partial [Actinomycetota bacterium]|nr:M48 family metalloprotease [Actinomycetota bacterium]